MKKLLYLSMFLWLVLTGCTQEKKEFTVLYNPQIEMFARFKTKSSFHKTKRII